MTLKTCNTCGAQKPLNDFFREASNITDGRRGSCKPCKQKETMAWREKNKDKYNAYMRERNKHHYPEYRLKRYDLTPAQHAQRVLEQGNKCKICKKAQKGKRPLVVDHHRHTGAVRGLLCYGCNRLIVGLDDHPLHDTILEYLGKKAA